MMRGIIAKLPQFLQGEFGENYYGGRWVRKLN
jgi:hypothetical protein